jgi:zinc-ribbon domain
MAQFCTKCGTPAPSGVKFCPKCGSAIPSQASAPSAPQPSAPAPAQAPPPAAPSPVTAAPAAKAASSGGLVKIVIAVVGFFVFVGVLGVGTCVYVGYKAKQKFEKAKAEYGLGNTGPAAQARDVCSLVTKEEATQFTGVTVTEDSGDTTKCDYFAAGHQLVLENDVSWEGARLALKLGVASLKAISGGVNPVVQLQGIGDEAYTIGLTGKEGEDLKKEAQTDQSGGAKVVMHVLSESPLMFRKGDVMVTVRLTQAVDPDAAKQGIAKAIAERL